jgi:hypothetical protein
MSLTEAEKRSTSEAFEKGWNDVRSSLHLGPSGRWSPKAGWVEFSAWGKSYRLPIVIPSSFYRLTLTEHL